MEQIQAVLAIASAMHRVHSVVVRADAEIANACQVLLSIRALGKSKAVLQQMPRPMRRPERAVLQLMESDPAAKVAYVH